MTQKAYIKKIILIALAFFIFSASESLAMTGSVDLSKDNKVKVCKDVTCANPKPGIIDFNVSGGSPLVIDTEKGISGKVSGNELGWITFNPADGGVFLADPATGLLKGTASTENSGPLNFSVTGQKVIIDPLTGEWNGWAWAAGSYGGWIKFDCKNASCVKIIWSGQAKTQTEAKLPSTDDASYGAYISSINPSPDLTPTAPLPADSPTPTMAEINIFGGAEGVIYEKAKILSDDFSIIAYRSVYLFDKSARMTAGIYDYLFSRLISLRNSFLTNVDRVFEFNF